MADEHTPNWQPISFLPKLTAMIDGMLYSAEDVYGSRNRRKTSRT